MIESFAEKTIGMQKMSEDSDFVYYQAHPGSLGTFALTALREEQHVEHEEEVFGSLEDQPRELFVGEEGVVAQRPLSWNDWYIYLGIIGLMCVFIVVFLIYHAHHRLPNDESKLEKLMRQYVGDEMDKGVRVELLRKKLITAGWKEKLVDKEIALAVEKRMKPKHNHKHAS